MTTSRTSFYSALAALTFVAACAPTAAPPAPAPAPAAPAAPTVMQTCPDPSDGPSIVVNAVEGARTALATNPSTPLPPPCVIAAFARIPGYVPDSLNEHALALATELGRRGASERDLLPGEIILLGHARRFQDVSRAYDRLAAVDPQPAMDVTRLAIAAAHERGDTAALLRLLARASARPDASPALKSELNVLRQAGALRGAINEARGLVRQNPKYLAAYPSLISNFGTLGWADSVVTNYRRAVAQGASRASLATSLDPLVNTMLRQAAVYGVAYGWDAPIGAAMRVDSVASTASTKFLIASLIAQSVEPQISEAASLVNGSSWLSQTLGRGSQSAVTANRTAGCARLATVSRGLAIAESKLNEGGNRYSGGGVPQLSAAINAEQSRVAELQGACGNPG